MKPFITVGIVVALFSSTGPAQERPPANDELAAWLKQRIKTWQPTAEERRFDDIAWVKDIRTALELARQHKRPVFLFTHDGHMDIGRC